MSSFILSYITVSYSRHIVARQSTVLGHGMYTRASPNGCSMPPPISMPRSLAHLVHLALVPAEQRPVPRLVARHALLRLLAGRKRT